MIGIQLQDSFDPNRELEKRLGPKVGPQLSITGVNINSCGVTVDAVLAWAGHCTLPPSSLVF